MVEAQGYAPYADYPHLFGKATDLQSAVGKGFQFFFVARSSGSVETRLPAGQKVFTITHS
jgi:hypothetical protein